MSIINDIRACLDTHLAGTASIPTVAHQNVPYEPDTGSEYVKATLVPTSRRPITRGINPQQRYDGVYLLLICTPEADGSGRGYSIADLLLDRFDTASSLYYDIITNSLLLESEAFITLESGSRVLLDNVIYLTLDYSEVGTSFLDSPFYCTPVTVSWHTFK